MLQRIKLHIRGVVQGVGFRPYIYRLSRKFKLGGHVFNDSQGVTIELEGKPQRIKDFIRQLKSNTPSVSTIKKIKQTRIFPKGEKEFSIKESKTYKDKSVFIPADIAICKHCRQELFNENNRRYLYPFINCTHCGPRFSVIKDIPYDRYETTMNSFTMCDKCLSEYNTASNRRFHAQVNACFDCGPQIKLLKKLKVIKSAGSRIQTADILEKTAKLIQEGKIIAIKGIGGYHLGCDAKNKGAVLRLRRLKNRPNKPFAIMIDDMKAVENVCFLNSKEKDALQSNRRPIVLLKIKNKMQWMQGVAPEQEYLGVMLAYAPLHYILFDYLKKYQNYPFLVMTSANKGDFPLISEEKELIQIKDYVDYSLTHNRDIHNRSDDSIVRVFEGKEVLIRKARGYTPDFISFANKKNILACGAELKNTFTLAKDGALVTSPYIGDLKNYRNYDFFLNSVSYFKKILDFKPEVVAHDLHPDYLSTQYAVSLNQGVKVGVQHHHAHLAACLFENKLKQKTIGVCFDGAGLGLDNAIWGGDFFITDTRCFERVAHFKYFGLLGADMATQEPARIAFYMLNQIFNKDFPRSSRGCVDYFDKKEKNILQKLINNKDFVLSSSAGRLFDAAASILNIKHKINYEAEAAITLEMIASDFKGRARPFDFAINQNNDGYIIDWQPIFSGIVKDMTVFADKRIIAYKFHLTFAIIIKEMALILRKKYGINNIALSGGVFQNVLLMHLTLDALREKGFRVYYHTRIPTNDSGISIGQAVVANAQII